MHVSLFLVSQSPIICLVTIAFIFSIVVVGAGVIYVSGKVTHPLYHPRNRRGRFFDTIARDLSGTTDNFVLKY